MLLSVLQLAKDLPPLFFSKAALFPSFFPSSRFLHFVTSLFGHMALIHERWNSTIVGKQEDPACSWADRTASLRGSLSRLDKVCRDTRKCIFVFTTDSEQGEDIYGFLTKLINHIKRLELLNNTSVSGTYSNAIIKNWSQLILKQSSMHCVDWKSAVTA